MRRDFAPHVGAAVALAACGHAALGPTPVMQATFVAASPNIGQPPPRNECWLSGRFEGMGFVRDGQLELVMPRGWIAVTRDNDKQWDDLHLVVEVGAHPFTDAHWPPVAKSTPVVLRPTVDSAGPQLTTWQSDDTLRLFVPWKQAIGPRWLVFVADYETLSHAGVRATCGGRMGTDTLRFAGHAP